MSNSIALRTQVLAAFALSLILVLPFTSKAEIAENRWIYPGQTLPADVPYVPLQVSSTGSGDVQVMPRDWFLLKSQELIVSTKAPATGAIRGYNGPVLNESNAQVYFRLVSGMILKESLRQMGMKTGQASVLIDRLNQSGRSIDTTPISDMGELPHGLDDLYNRWDRPMSRLAVIPYLLLPLSIANSESSFQHFFQTSVVNDSPDKKCSTVNTAAPVGAIQSKIADRQSKLDLLNNSVRNATDPLDQSNREITALTDHVNVMSTNIDDLSSCVTAIRERISRGSARPTDDCLAKAKANLDPEAATQWNKFVTVNLANAKGDFNVKQELGLSLQDTQAKLDNARHALDAQKETRAKAAGDLAQSEDKIKKSQADLKTISDHQDSLNTEEKSLNQEFQDLLSERFKLDQGTLGRDMSEADLQQTIKAMPDHNRRMDAIKLRLPNILAERGKLQTSSAAIVTQIEFLNRTIDTDKATVNAIDAQTADAQAVAQLEKQAAQANSVFLAASDASTFDDYILSFLSRKLISISQDRDAELATLKKQQTNNAALKVALANAVKTKQNSWDGLQKEVLDLQSQLTNYLGDGHMGWFLEGDCSSREQLDGTQIGVFLARAQTNAKTRTDSAPVEGGKWGLFNIDYSHFQTSIDSGVLLNLPEFIRMTVQNSIQNFDYAIAQYMDASAPRCKELNGSNYGTAVLDLMGTAFAIWSEGSDSQAKSKTYCRTNTEKQNYLNSLSRFLAFDSSVLDQALPRTNSDAGNGLNERQAITALVTEMRILAGVSQDSNSGAAAGQRRDDLIRSLIKIMAYDYDKAIDRAQQLQAAGGELRLAGTAPGGSPSAAVAAKLLPGSSYTILMPSQTRVYQAPIAKTETDAGVVQTNDQVTILPIEPGSTETVRAGWVKIQVLNQRKDKGAAGIYWASASSISDAIQAPPSQPPAAQIGGTSPNAVSTATPSADAKTCPLRRLVTSMEGYDGGIVPRYVPEVKLVKSQWDNVWFIGSKINHLTSPAISGKTYIACEVLSIDGKPAMTRVPDQLRVVGGVDYTQAIGIRVVNARTEVRNGVTHYVPTEDFGGFVATWFSDGSRKARIVVGAQLDESWNLKQ